MNGVDAEGAKALDTSVRKSMRLAFDRLAAQGVVSEWLLGYPGGGGWTLPEWSGRREGARVVPHKMQISDIDKSDGTP